MTSEIPNRNLQNGIKRDIECNLPVTQHNSGISISGPVCPARRSFFDGLLISNG
jgi:hypothetical protein